MFALQTLTTWILLSIDQLWDNRRLNHFPTKPNLVAVVKKLLTLSEPMKLFWPLYYEHVLNLCLQKMINRIPELSAPVDRRNYCDVIEDVYSSASYMLEALGDLCWLRMWFCLLFNNILFKWNLCIIIWLNLRESYNSRHFCNYFCMLKTISKKFIVKYFS